MGLQQICLGISVDSCMDEDSTSNLDVLENRFFLLEPLDENKAQPKT